MPRFDHHPEEDLRVIDYIKQKLFSRPQVTVEAGLDDMANNYDLLSVSEVDDVNQKLASKEPVAETKRPAVLFFASVVVLFIAQLIFEYKLSKSPGFGLVLILLAGIGIFISLKTDRLNIENPQTLLNNRHATSQKNVWMTLSSAFIMGGLAFVLFLNNGLGWFQVLIWLASIAALIYGFWDWDIALKKEAEDSVDSRKKRPSIKEIINHDKPFYLALLIVVIVLLVFHILFLLKLPIELVSQQVETYLSVEEIRAGSWEMFFPRNVVGEPLNYYWLAFVSLFFGPGSLLLASYVGQAFSFAVGLVFLFYLGRLLLNKWVGLGAVLAFGLGFWPVLQNYAMIGGGLVFPILSAALFFLFRGLLKDRQLDFVLFGIVSGLGLLSNKLFLMMPIVGLVFYFVWILHHWKERKQLHWKPRLSLGLFAMGIMAIPLLVVIKSYPGVYFEPILSRLGNTEVMIEGSPVLVFLKNLWAGLGIMHWSNRSSWVDGIANRPALELISAVLFIVGLLGVIWRYVAERRWQWLAILILLIIFLLPSVMSIAFPLEKPSLSRAFGLAIPAFLLVGYGLYMIFQQMAKRHQKVKLVFLVIISAVIIFGNGHLLHNVYPKNFKQNAWNTSDIAQTINKFKNTYGKEAKARVVGYPHWVDERAVAIMAGLPANELLMDAAGFDGFKEDQGAKLFVLNPEATEEMSRLKELFPNGVESLVQSTQVGKDFVIYLVPGE